MPGAWEIKFPEVLVGILTRETVATKWAMAFRNMILPPSGVISFQVGMPFDHARNSVCQRAIAENYKWLMFIDDDVIMPPDTYARLSSHGYDIVTGLYYKRSAPIAPVLLRDTKPSPSYVTDIVAPGVSEVDLCGAGCLLISVKALKTISYPWFEWKVDRIPSNATSDSLNTNTTYAHRCAIDMTYHHQIDVVRISHSVEKQNRVGLRFTLTLQYNASTLD
jgi:hypothetical protein